MEVLRVARVLTRDDIRAAPEGSQPHQGVAVPADDQGARLRISPIRVEMVKICPHYSDCGTSYRACGRRCGALSAFDGLQRLNRTHPGPASGFAGTVPVLTRGRVAPVRSHTARRAGRRRCLEPWPTLGDIQIVPVRAGAGAATSWSSGDGLDISGVELAGDRVSALFHHVRLKEPNTLQPAPWRDDGEGAVHSRRHFDNTLPNFDAAAAERVAV